MSDSIGELIEKARTARNGQDFQAALDLYLKALGAIPEGNDADKANLYTEIGLMLDELGEYEEAIKHHSAALDLFEKLKNASDIADAHYNLCITYINSNNPEKANLHASASFKLYETLNNEAGVADALYANGLTANLQEKSAEAIEYLKKAIKSYKKIGQNEGVSSVLLDLGNIYLNEENYEEAIKQFKMASKIFEETQDFGGIGDAETCIARAYEDKEDLARSYDFYVSAAEAYVKAQLFDLARDNLDIVEPNLMSMPKATRKRLRNIVWDLKAKLPKEEPKKEALSADADGGNVDDDFKKLFTEEDLRTLGEDLSKADEEDEEENEDE